MLYKDQKISCTINITGMGSLGRIESKSTHKFKLNIYG